LSTLTKVLIVLLTIFSIFLCGIVVTYAATAENYRQTADTTGQQLRSAKATRESAERAKEEADKNVEATKADLGAKLAARDSEITRLRADLENAKRTNDQLQVKVASMADVMANTSAAVKQQTTLHEAAQQRVQALEAERTQNEKELAETSQALLEKVTIIVQHEDTIRRLTQENQELGNRLNQSLVQYGKTATRPPTTVAPGSPTAQPVRPVTPIASPTKNLGLNGQINMVDLRSRLVEISIGAAAGVRSDMTFHVTRGDRWVATLLILEVAPDKAVGILDLVQSGLQPQAGDRVTTNL